MTLDIMQCVLAVWGLTVKVARIIDGVDLTCMLCITSQFLQLGSCQDP